MTLLLVAGTRPQFVKSAALLPALREREEVVWLRTGQHADSRMVDAHFAGLDLPPVDRTLDPGPARGAARLAAMVAGIAGVIAACKPRRLIAMGDTDTTLAACLAASHERLPLAHVEAGARSGERDLPEERNRILADELADLLLCSTPGHAENLAVRTGVHVTGDVMADVLLARKDRILAHRPDSGAPYALLTLHRAAIAEDPEAIRELLQAAAAEGLEVRFPCHPRTRAALPEVPAGVDLLPPLPYLEFLGLVSGAVCVLTDSGGLQKEAYLLGVPCITLRGATEWTGTVEAGWNRLAGADPERIREAMRNPPRGPARPALYGDGQAARRIAELV